MAKNSVDVADRAAHYDVTPNGNVSYLLRSRPQQLLVVTDEQRAHSDLFVLDKSGVWVRGDADLYQWLIERGVDLRQQAVRERMDDKALLAILRGLKLLDDPRSLQPIRDIAVGALQAIRAANARINLKPTDDEVTMCLVDQLDANVRYIGAQNGVVDLDAGELLSPEEGRKHLVTTRAPVAFRLEATHPDVDRLFAHLPADERDWWWLVLGYALRGSPSARIYEVIGPPNGGKSGLMAALNATLGPYAGIPSSGLLEYRRGAVESETGLSPGVVAMVPPRRLAMFDEVKPTRLNNKLLKDWSGDGAGVTWRTLHREPRTDRVTATMFLFCNPGQEAHLGMQDAGMRRRLRTLRYPVIPDDKRIADFNTARTHAPAFQEALLARLVKAASEGRTGAPPEAPPSVMATTAERISEDVGEIGRFAKRLQKGEGGSVLTIQQVWCAWCKHNGADPNQAKEEVDGISRHRLSTVLRSYVFDLPKPRPLGGRVGGRGWRGWRLLDDLSDAVTKLLDFPATMVQSVSDPDGDAIWIPAGKYNLQDLTNRMAACRQRLINEGRLRDYQINQRYSFRRGADMAVAGVAVDVAVDVAVEWLER